MNSGISGGEDNPCKFCTIKHACCGDTFLEQTPEEYHHSNRHICLGSKKKCKPFCFQEGTVSGENSTSKGICKGCYAVGYRIIELQDGGIMARLENQRNHGNKNVTNRHNGERRTDVNRGKTNTNVSREGSSKRNELLRLDVSESEDESEDDSNSDLSVLITRHVGRTTERRRKHRYTSYPSVEEEEPGPKTDKERLTNSLYRKYVDACA